MRAPPAVVRQVIRFGVVGFFQLGLDWLTFFLLTLVGTVPGLANVAGRVLSASVGFWVNGKWTFASGDKPSISRRALVRYVILWVANTAISTLIVSLVDQAHGLHWTWAVKPVADAILAALGFAVSKYWIYR